MILNQDCADTYKFHQNIRLLTPTVYKYMDFVQVGTNHAQSVTN